MRHIILFTILAATLLFAGFSSCEGAGNPFTTKQNTFSPLPGKTVSSKSTVLSKVFLKIIVWQQYLKEKMTHLVKQAREGGSVKPVLVLIFIAFSYGVIHAAGPGHGKAVALSYVLAQRPSFVQGLLFSNSIAFFHGVSGIIFVLFVYFVLKSNIMGSLDSITNITQVISYGLIACLGLGIFFYSIYKLVKNNNGLSERKDKSLNPVLSAAIVGCIPCPGVVIVMLFALSMNLLYLSVILGIAISLGMGLTISIVILLAISGKLFSLNAASRSGKNTGRLEIWIELFAGMVLMLLGGLFLGANL